MEERATLARPLLQFVHEGTSPSDLARTAGGAIDDYLGVGSSGGGTNQNFPGQGRYGMNWWFNEPSTTWPNAPTDTFMTIGHGCKENMVIIPSLQIVAAWKGREAALGQAFAACNSYIKLLVEAHP
jgi:hypothetical protein